MGPTLAGFQAWVYGVMGIPESVLPTNSAAFTWAYNAALNWVDPTLNAMSVFCWSPANPNSSGSFYYQLAVYNLGGSNLINWAPDLPNAPAYQNKLPYFAYMREKFNIYGPVTGVISSASDQGTSGGLEIPEALKNLTLADLQQLKDVWGRTYLGIAQQQGSLWNMA